LAKCPVCKEEQFGYEWTVTKNGKKWLKNSNGQWHDCPKSTGRYEKQQKYIILKDVDFDFCDGCGKMYYKEETLQKHPTLFGLTLEEHKKKWHPNDEILDDIDYMVLTDEHREILRKKWNKPQPVTKYYLDGKKLRNYNK